MRLKKAGKPDTEDLTDLLGFLFVFSYFQLKILLSETSVISN